jgi:glycosyltransferase involved in cell wall biosynthesis
MISIITPSFNMLPYLKRAAASVADQSYGDTEHIVIDGASNDGTKEWLSSEPFPGMSYVSEPDQGMYDAVNKGLKQAKGDILAYLNCDEQYLPGTLEYVAAYFDSHPEVDIIFGDLLLTRLDGSLLAFRKGYQPRWVYILASHLYVLSCTMFFRHRVIEDGHLFDTRYKAVADAHFVVNLLRNRYKARHLKRYLSAFTITGQNLSIDERALAEQKDLLNHAPAYVRMLKPLINLMRLGEKFLGGAYVQGGPIDYQAYTGADGQDHTDMDMKRQHFHVEKASFRWSFEEKGKK